MKRHNDLYKALKYANEILKLFIYVTIMVVFFKIINYYSHEYNVGKNTEHGRQVPSIGK